MKNSKQKIKRVLAWVNRIRVITDQEPLKKLVKGKCGSSTNCPIRNSIGKPVKSITSFMEFRSIKQALEVSKKIRRVIWITDLEVEMPTYVKKFISDFDDGVYPKLEK